MAVAFIDEVHSMEFDGPQGFRKVVTPVHVPLGRHVESLSRIRAWTRPWPPGVLLVGDLPDPNSVDALRELLKSPNPDVRGLAAESLATFHVPEDVARIAALLGDESPSVPALDEVRPPKSMVRDASALEPNPDAPDWRLDWVERSVDGYARAALALITGVQLTAATYPEWWLQLGEPRHSLWHWQHRIHKAMTEIDREVFGDRSEENWNHEARMRERDERRARALDGLTEDLAMLPAKVHAKVLLLASTTHWNQSELSGEPTVMGLRSRQVPLPKARLLELLEGKGLWPDVDWDGNDALFERLVQRIALASSVHFGPAESNILQAIARANRNEGRPRLRDGAQEAALLIGASRVLPDADPGDLDRIGTRDGLLRETLRSHPEAAVRSFVACELLRVDLARNLEFVAQQAFSEPDNSYVLMSVVNEFGVEPVTDAKRDALRWTLMDDRFVRHWLCTEQFGESCSARHAAESTLKRVTGQHVLTSTDTQLLASEDDGPEHLLHVLRRIDQVLR
tara:strand:- start:19640 stop:21175 length:1536 start_codon:yes stop_codon:yes gene_type:complete